MKTTLSLTFTLLAVFALGACGESTDPDNMDMKMDMKMETKKRLPIASIGTIESPADKDADFSCLGMRAVPSSTSAAISFDLEIKDFEDDFHTEGLRVQVFADNLIDLDNCAAPNCVEGMTDKDGIVQGAQAAVIPGKWYAYRVFAKQGTTRDDTAVDSVQFNELLAPGKTANEGVSVSIRTLDLIPTVLGFNRAPQTAVLAGSISDCNGDNVYGTRIKILDAVSRDEIEEGPKQSDPHLRYFDGDDFPSATQPFTHVDGLFAGANLPITDGKSRDVIVEIYGRLVGDQEEQLFARTNATILPDTVTLLNLEPLYAD